MQERQERLEALRGRMAAGGVDLVAVGPTTNMRYLLGYAAKPDERPSLLLVTAEDACLVVPELNAAQWAAHVDDLALLEWPDEEGPGGALAAALGADAAQGIGQLALDGFTFVDYVLPLVDFVKPRRLLSASPLFAALRQRKSPDEIEKLVRASAQADRVLETAVEASRPGAGEREVMWAVETAFRQDGAEEVNWAIVASGPNTAYPSHFPTDRRMQAGEPVMFDLVATLDGYKSDITRMAHLGEPGAEVMRVYEAVSEANRRAIAAVRPGIRACDVDRAARGVLEEAGYGEFFIHRTGHGIGLDVHEAPWIVEGNETVLEEGMVFTVEPGVYLSGRFGVRIEDIVVVTAEGARVITGAPREMIVKA